MISISTSPARGPSRSTSAISSGCPAPPAPSPSPAASGIGVIVQLSTDINDACGASSTTKYTTTGGIYNGLVLYDDISLTSPDDYRNCEYITLVFGEFGGTDPNVPVITGNSNSFVYKIEDKEINSITLQLKNERGEFLTDAPNYMIVIQYIFNERDDTNKLLKSIDYTIRQIYDAFLFAMQRLRLLL